MRSPIAIAGRWSRSTRTLGFQEGRAGRSGRRSTACSKAAVRREFDVIMAWSVDRLGRSLQDLMAFSFGHPCQGRRAIPPPASIDTTTPSGDVGTSVIQRIEAKGAGEKAPEC
jgi:DNA invertase Pin-like site-specific DNA recombinase